jgi:hypothetical protein
VDESEGAEEHTAYCARCRERRRFIGEEIELVNGRRAAQGACPSCGTTLVAVLRAPR